MSDSSRSQVERVLDKGYREIEKRWERWRKESMPTKKVQSEVVWFETWSGFEMWVRIVPSGYQSIMNPLGDNPAVMCKTVRSSIAEAQRRCFGLVRGHLELKAQQAASVMYSINLDDV